jgi:DNA-binding CsgD family transcriptional regulator
MEFFLGLFLDGDWPRIAVTWTREATHPVGSEGLQGPHIAAMAAQAHARAGAEVEARRILAELVPLLELVGFDSYGHSGATALAAGAAWDLGLAEGAPRLRALAEGQIARGSGDVPSTSRHLTVARTAALAGDLDGAIAAFAATRPVLESQGQRPLRAMVDHDEALARRRAAGALGARQAAVASLAETARTAFAALGMEGWAERAAALAGGGPTAAAPIATTGLTARELDVLRLIARGMSDRQIGEQLGLSGRTVGTHVRHMLAKTTLDNRTELSVWAVERGLVER